MLASPVTRCRLLAGVGLTVVAGAVSVMLLGAFGEDSYHQDGLSAWDHRPTSAHWTLVAVLGIEALLAGAVLVGGASRRPRLALNVVLASLPLHLGLVYAVALVFRSN